MSMMLAQESITSLPDNWWKNFCIALLILLGAAGVVVAIWASTRKAGPVKIDDDPAIAVRKAPKRYNHDLAEQRYGEVTGRLNDHDAELDSIWSEIATEDSKLRSEIQLVRENNSTRFERIASDLGEIKGALGIKSHPQS